MKLTIALVILLAGLCSCSHKATFYKGEDEVARVESRSAGKFTYKDEDVEIGVDFSRPPLIQLGNISPKFEN